MTRPSFGPTELFPLPKPADSCFPPQVKRPHPSSGKPSPASRGCHRHRISSQAAPRPCSAVVCPRLDPRGLGAQWYSGVFPEPLARSLRNPKACTPVARPPKFSSQEASENAGETMFLPSLPLWFLLVMRTTFLASSGTTQATALPSAQPAQTRVCGRRKPGCIRVGSCVCFTDSQPWCP